MFLNWVYYKIDPNVGTFKNIDWSRAVICELNISNLSIYDPDLPGQLRFNKMENLLSTMQAHRPHWR
jgi:hypothetical protein